MNDETPDNTHNDIIDETARPTAAGEPATSESGTERAGFCQDCGRPLTKETIRTVGSGVFCEPCLETRLAGGRNTAYAAGYTAGPVSTSDPSPTLAAWLGLLPGVGAMYNGQYAKGMVHLVIFAVLVSIGKSVEA